MEHGTPNIEHARTHSCRSNLLKVGLLFHSCTGDFLLGKNFMRLYFFSRVDESGFLHNF